MNKCMLCGKRLAKKHPEDTGACKCTTPRIRGGWKTLVHKDKKRESKKNPPID